MTHSKRYSNDDLADILAQGLSGGGSGRCGHLPLALLTLSISETLNEIPPPTTLQELEAALGRRLNGGAATANAMATLRHLAREAPETPLLDLAAKMVEGGPSPH